MSSRKKNKQAQRDARVRRPDVPPLLLRCLGGPEGCNDVIELPAGLEVGQAAAFLFQSKGWLVSVVSQPDARPTTIAGYALAPLCPTCAEQVHPPEVIAAARQSLGQADTWVVPATSYGELEVRRKAGAEIVKRIEEILARPGMWTEDPRELRFLIEGHLGALCEVRPSHGYREFCPMEKHEHKAGVGRWSATLAGVAEWLLAMTHECVAWLDANEATCWKRISS